MRKPRGSMLDEFKETIEYYLEKGYQIKEIHEMFGEGYTYSCFYGFCRKHGLTSTERKPCINCEHCMYVRTETGKTRKVCMKFKQIIPWKTVRPRFCELREGET